jgi:hypothetical protein
LQAGRGSNHYGKDVDRGIKISGSDVKTVRMTGGFVK